MLVLSRKVGESIVLIDNRTGERIRLIQVRIGPTTSRIGIEASQSYTILRSEFDRPDEVAEELTAAS